MEQTIGISLAGGGARGITHIGVLKALEEQGIRPSAISGASAGSLMGVLYAAGKSPDEMLEIVKETSLTQMLRPSFLSSGLADLSGLKKVLENIIPFDNFESLLKPLYVSVTNLSKGRWEIYSKGPLYEIILASCSIPLLFKTRQIGEDLFADGGVMNNLPVEPLVRSCDKVIGVNVTPIDLEEKLGSLMEIGYRTLDLVLWSNVEPRLKMCDVVIEPQSDEFGLFDIEKADELVQLGYQAALERLPELEKMFSP